MSQTPPTTDTQALHQEIRDLLDSSSHFLRTPLWAVAEFARMLQDECGTQLDQSGAENLEHIRSGMARMSGLVECLTRFAELCRQPMAPQRVDLSALVLVASHALQTTAPERKAQFVIQPELTVQADPDLLLKLTEILLANAWKFSQSQPATEVQFGREPESGAFFIRDNGVGFDEALAYKLFRPFQRLHAAPDLDGQGLGLAMARRIVHLHGGRIWAHSPTSAGATFFFTLAACQT